MTRALRSPTGSDSRHKVLIVGGGISGLATAVRLVELAQARDEFFLEITLCEQNTNWGGVLQTQPLSDGFVERCADMFTTKLPWALQLCKTIGFLDQLIPTDEGRRGALVATRNGVAPIPAGFSLLVPQRWDTLWKSDILSRSAKFRMRMEPWIMLLRRKFRPGLTADESFQSFAIRHWGKEAYDWLIQPLVSGIFTADPAKLSMDAALTEFADLERQHGSLLKSAKRKALDSAGTDHSSAQLQDALTATSGPGQPDSSGVRYGLFLTPREGMSSWVHAIVDWLDKRGVQLEIGTRVERLTRDKHDWSVVRFRPAATEPTIENFDSVVLATPAQAASNLMKDIDVDLANRLREIEYASAAIVVSRFRRSQFVNDTEKLGFGLVVPTILGSPLIATSFASQKFPGRCTPSDLLTRSFFGGALNPDHVEWDDQRLIDCANRELSRWIPFHGEPLESQVVRWQNAMPQYHVGHRDRVAVINQLLAKQPGLALAGNAYDGVGIPQCIKSGWDAAAQVLSR
ncbi:MAG: protoporphyrinogen oxidase [Planctomycetaceae bacterium]|nr:protoporphyrinogen oxidase [Planctomycetaceae bacterium]